MKYKLKQEAIEFLKTLVKENKLSDNIKYIEDIANADLNDDYETVDAEFYDYETISGRDLTVKFSVNDFEESLKNKTPSENNFVRLDLLNQKETERYINKLGFYAFATCVVIKTEEEEDELDLHDIRGLVPTLDNVSIASLWHNNGDQVSIEVLDRVESHTVHQNDEEASLYWIRML